jgi:hypothetical protein|tara:strand:+ start:809 stop:1390 length:582 start_codon:yes stop_codon:yes gene_type:complete
MAYDFCDYRSKRTVTFNGSTVTKTVECSNSTFADNIEEAWVNLDRSKFKTQIVDFSYKREANTFTITYDKLNEENWVHSRDFPKLTNAAVIQLYKDFVEPCNEGYPIYYDCGNLKNMFYVGGKLTLIDVDAMCINPNKNELNSIFWFRMAHRVGPHTKNLMSQVNAPPVDTSLFPDYVVKPGEHMDTKAFFNG